MQSQNIALLYQNYWQFTRFCIYTKSKIMKYRFEFLSIQSIYKKFCSYSRIYARYASKTANAVTPNPIGLSIEAKFRITNVKLQV